MSYVLFALLGGVIGVVSGLFGIGGAVLMVPALVLIFHFSQHEAQGTSLAVLLPPIGVLAVWRYWQAGFVRLVPALIIAAAFILGAALGAHFAIAIPPAIMKRLFGGLLIVLGGMMLLGA